ncbi:hypothetical protein AMATHDRAFT_79883 [Amanita thiersii Skay4041]|uniref:Potassium transport protein n=1 Tax=Amanita thiersii Skay4041 TaxID=703135 RepID=A0A2A9NME3_9AGAR|nr:hypothetical protein AMATHDRAFT_79883 [Amanita thiersii Skay4041]
MDTATPRPPVHQLGKLLRRNLNFFRVHTLYFTFTPLIWASILYGSNGENKIAFIDSLFICISAMTMSGLATVDLSLLTPWQQVILFILMVTGSPIVLSWVVVFIRRYYFAKHFAHVVNVDRSLIYGTGSSGTKVSRWLFSPFSSFFASKKQISVEEKEFDQAQLGAEPKKGFIQRLTPDMIRRIDETPKPVNPSGWVSGEPSPPETPRNLEQSRQEPDHRLSIARSSSMHAHEPSIQLQLPSQPPKYRRGSLFKHHGMKMTRRLSDPGQTSIPSSPTQTAIQRFDTVGGGVHSPRNREIGPRTHTVEFASSPNGPRRHGRREHNGYSDTTAEMMQGERNFTRRQSVPLVSLNTNTSRTSYPPIAQDARTQGFGGFPTPLRILRSFLDRFFPTFKLKLTRTITIPTTTSLVSGRPDAPPGAKNVPYISFDAVVGRNSSFQGLTSEELEELGGVEYRALNALLWIIAAYYFGIQLISFTVIAPYMSQARWASDLTTPQLHRPLNSVWFSAFQVVSALSNTGMSLVDQSMVPFQTAYPMILFMAFNILAGNTCYPILLRFSIWITSKCVPKTSRTNETLRFLLDHPRRCFIYLFPSHQTWFLLTVVLLLTGSDWFFFMVLDIGNTSIEQIPIGVRFLAGCFQAVAVRTAGFTIVLLADLAPAVKVLFVVMMYISAFPIALSVRSTNVYEERSLGIYPKEIDEGDFQPTGTRATIWSKYLALHARKQLAFDMWWLAFALFLICIIERGNLTNPDNATWFTIFNILFEIVSAYGTVGLSMGVPTGNYSFSGAFHTLSKLVICAVMLRGRHRGLPVAIDRAVMLPSQFRKQDEVDSLNGSRNVHTGGEDEYIIEERRNSETDDEQQKNGEVLM